MSAIEDFKQFVIDAESGLQYVKWAHDNPGELDRWTVFKNAVLAGQLPLPPTMTSAHGKELVDTAIMTEHFRVLEQSIKVVPTTKTSSLKANTVLVGTNTWVVETLGDCVKIELWANSTKVGEVLGISPYYFRFDTTKLVNGSYVFGIVEVDSMGIRHPDENRVTASIANPVVTLMGTTVVGGTLSGTIKAA